MAKELYLYTSIYNYTAQALIEAMNALMGRETSIRVNSPGGDVLAFWGMVAKMKEHGNITLKYDGGGFSAAANLALYAKRVEALKVSKFMFHRADGYAETDEQKKFLADVNADLKSRMSAKVDAGKFLQITGYSIDQMFDLNQRINIFLTADQMKELNLVDEVKDIEPSEVNAISDQFFKIAAEFNKDKTDNPIIMNTLADLKEKYPAIYAQAFGEGVTAGVKKEFDRVNSIMVFAHLDAEGAKKIIASGEMMTETQRSEFALKAMSPEALKKVEAGNAATVKTDDATKAVAGKENKELESFEASVKAELGLVTVEKKGNTVLAQLKN